MLQIALLIYGVYVLFSGKFSFGKQKVVYGFRARVLGLICLLSLPFAFVCGITLGVLAQMGKIELPKYAVVLDVGIVVFTLVLVYSLGKVFLRQQMREQSDRSDVHMAAVASTDSSNPYSPPSRIQ